jgi:hypothetical protein
MADSGGRWACGQPGGRADRRTGGHPSGRYDTCYRRAYAAYLRYRRWKIRREPHQRGRENEPILLKQKKGRR